MGLDLGVATAVGAVVFLVVVWPEGTSDPRARTVGWVALAAAAGAGAILAVLQVAVANGVAVTDAIGPARVGDLLRFRFGRVAATRLVLLGGAGVLVGGLLAGGPRVAASWAWRVAGLVVGLGVLQTLGAVGHSTAAGPLGMSARLVHLASVSVWLGGLFLLLAVMAPRKRARAFDGLPLDELLPRFSAVAGGAVVTLASSGLAMALEIVGSPANLVTTPYGRTLALKAAVVGAVLVAASRSRARVRGRMVPVPSGVRGAQGGRATATRTPVATWIALEVAGMVAIVGISALLTALPPPV
jgi:copper transport protein